MSESFDSRAIVANRPIYVPTPGDKARASFIGVQPLIQQDKLDVKSGIDVQKYSAIWRNPVVNTALTTIIASVLWTEATVQAANNYKLNPEFRQIDVQLIKFINNELSNLEYDNFRSIIKSILTRSLVFGFSISEIVWIWKDNYWGVQSIKPKPSYNFNIWVDNSDNIEGLYHMLNVSGPRELDPRGFIIATWPYLADGNYYGISILQSIMHDVKLLEKLEELRAKGLSLLCVKPLIHYYEAIGRSEVEIDAALDAVAKMESSSVVRLPMKINPNEPDKVMKSDIIQVLDDRASQKAMDDVNTVIEQLEKRINRQIGVPDDLGYSTTTVGSLAKAQEETNLYTARVEEAEEWLEKTINAQLIRRMIDVNYANLPKDYKYPVWKRHEIEEDVTADKIAALSTAIDKGIIQADESWVRERAGFPQVGGESEIH